MTTEAISTNQEIAYVNRFMVEQAWREQVQAVDRWEWLAERNYPKHAIEAAWEDVEAATAHAVELDRLYSEQYEQAVQS
jgi:hypothetical protein